MQYHISEMHRERWIIVDDQHGRTEEFRVRGEELVDKIKEVIHEGNIRRLIIQNAEGRTLIEIPLTLGVIGAVLAPVWAAIGAIAALAADYRIIVEKTDA